MSSHMGHTITYQLFGESHGPAIGMTINGLPPGCLIDDKAIERRLKQRATGGAYASQRKEADRVEWLSGVFKDHTTGGPLTFIIRNTGFESKDYDALKDIMRPSHADYAARIKYQGYNDYRGGGLFSGRLTACFVVAGTLVRSLLNTEGVTIRANLTQLGKLSLPFESGSNDQVPWLDNLNVDYKKIVAGYLSEIQSQGDSVGGRVRVQVTGLKPGLGQPHFDSIESVLSHWLFSIPGVKAVEFGLGTDFATAIGSQVKDGLTYKNGQVTHTSNHNGGVTGGLSTGMPLDLACTFKPTSSIYKAQDTINMATQTNTSLEITGRHDPAFVIRTPIVVESVVAMALYDLTRRTL